MGGVVGDALARAPAVVFGPPGITYRLVLGLILFAGLLAGSDHADEPRVAPKTAAPRPGFTTLFNGKDFTGWHGQKTMDPREFEALSLALRTPRGVPWGSVRDPEDLAGPSPDALVVREGDRAVLTVRGRLLANEVSTRIRSGILHR